MASMNRLSSKIILMVEAILLVTSILFCTVSVFRARIGIRKAIQQRMLDIANCASGSVKGDTLKALTEADVGSAAYRDIYDKLAVFRDNVEMEYVYCIRDQGDGQFIFTMDLDLYTPASFGDSVKYTDALASASRGKAAVDEVPYSDAWGTFYSAYSPVLDSSGNVAGIIAVDFSAGWFDAQLSAQTRSTIVSYFVILLISRYIFEWYASIGAGTMIAKKHKIIGTLVAFLILDNISYAVTGGFVAIATSVAPDYFTELSQSGGKALQLVVLGYSGVNLLLAGLLFWLLTYIMKHKLNLE